MYFVMETIIHLNVTSLTLPTPPTWRHLNSWNADELISFYFLHRVHSSNGTVNLLGDLCMLRCMRVTPEFT